MAVFLVIGGLGLVLLLASLVLGELFDGVLDGVDFLPDVDHSGGAGLFSTPVIASFLAAFGFGGAILLATTDAGVFGATLTGTVCGLVVGWIALRVTRALMHMPTDATYRTTDLVGKTATVLTRIPAGGLGEVSVAHLGQVSKYSARASEPVPVGTTVTVTSVLSSSALMVSPSRPAARDLDVQNQHPPTSP